MTSLGGHRVLHATDLGEHRCMFVHSRTDQCGIGYGALHGQVSQHELAGATFLKIGNFPASWREYSVSTSVRTEYVQVRTGIRLEKYVFLASSTYFYHDSCTQYVHGTYCFELYVLSTYLE